MSRSLPFLLLLTTACGTPKLIDEARVDALAELTRAVDRDRVMATVTELVDSHVTDEKIDCGGLETKSSLNEAETTFCDLSRARALTYLTEAFGALGLAVTTDHHAHPEFPTTNVFADLVGETRPDEVVLVGAHFDAFHGGADDNSSGVAAMLELARILSGKRFARTIRFVGFDLEELGLVGSTRFVQDGHGERVVAAVIYDCVGFASSEPNSQKGLTGFPLPTVGDFLGVIANETSSLEASQLRAINARLGIMRTEGVVAPSDGAWPLTGNLLRSDHGPFWLKGKSALFLTDTANFRNPNYHRPSDTVDTLDPDFLANVARLSAVSVAYWAEPL